MSKDMLGPLTRALVGIPAKMLGIIIEITNRFGSENGESFYTDLARFVKEWKKSAVEVVVEKLLDVVGTITFPGFTEKFIARDKFVVDTSRQAKVKIYYVGDNFKSWFEEKTEDPLTESTLHCYKLRKSSVDEPIIAELGGEEKVEATLAEVYSLMEKQGNGQDGKLLTNGYANIFYIKDLSGVLRAVDVVWGGDGWGVDAGEVSGPGAWRGGRRVFSRN